MKSREKRLTRGDVGTFRKERRKILNARQNEYFRLLGKDAKATADLENRTIAELRELAGRMDEGRHEQAPAWEVAHAGILDRLRKLSEEPRWRDLDPNWPELPPRPEPEDFFEEPTEDLPDFPPQKPVFPLCSVTTIRLDTMANHGETITQSPQSSKNIVAAINFDTTPGLNEVKMTVGIDNESKTADVAITADAAWLFHFHPPTTGLYTVRPLAFLNGLWVLWANTPGLIPSAGSLRVTVGARVTQFDGLTLYETADRDVVSVTATDENLEGEIVYDSASTGAPLEIPANLAKELRTHIIVRCTVSLRLTGSGLARVNLKDSKFYFRVPEVQIDRFDCHGFLPSDRPRLNITPLLLAMRKNDQFQVRITADPPFDGSVQLTSSNPAAASVISPIDLQGGTGFTFVTARERNRQLNIFVRRDGYVQGSATVYVENDAGVWNEGRYIDDFVAVHAAVLRTGKVLMFSASHETELDLAVIDKGKSFLWNWQDDSLTPVPISRNLFCSGHCFLADGRLLVAGGQNLWQLGRGAKANYPWNAGADKDVHTFDPIEERWEKHGDLADKRWYPTCVTTPNGRGLIVGGVRWDLNPGPRYYNKTRETFRPNSNSLTDAVFFRGDLLYPFLQVLPGDFIFVHRKRWANIFDLDADDWLRDSGGERLSFRTNHDGTRTYPGQGCCVPLTIDATDPDPTLLLVIGGSEVLDPDKESKTTDSVEIFEFRRSDPANCRWRRVAPLPDKRFMCDGVLLADGSVFVTNGAGKGVADHSSGDRLSSYIFEPWNNVWLTVGESPLLRAYHSTALMLPDGRVLVGGSTGHVLTDLNILHRDDEFRLDIFTPPYLTRGPRPTILGAPDEIGLGEEFEIQVGGFSANQISEVALMRPGSTTHSVNMDQRRVRLPILERRAGTVRVTAPTELSVAPRGFYMLFVLNQFGVPSVGKFVHLG